MGKRLLTYVVQNYFTRFRALTELGRWVQRPILHEIKSAKRTKQPRKITRRVL